MALPVVIPERFRQAVAAELAGEPVLWAGRPASGRVLARSLAIWLFAIPWTAFALGWEYVAVAAMLSGGGTGPASAMAYVFPVFGLPFVLVGLGMLAAPFWIGRATARSLHLLTSRRLVTLTLGRATGVRSLDPAGIVGLSRRERPDGSGDLTMEFGSRRDADGDVVSRSETWSGVPQVRALETLLGGWARRAA